MVQSRMISRGLTVVIVVVLAVLAIACTGDNGHPCYVGDFQSCTCADGTRGYAKCAQDQGGYGACDCTTNPFFPDASLQPADAGAPETSGDGGLLPFLADCTDNSQCSTGLCFRFNARGPKCSKTCKMDADCPAPSPGCNMMGICKSG